MELLILRQLSEQSKAQTKYTQQFQQRNIYALQKNKARITDPMDRALQWEMCGGDSPGSEAASG